MLKPLSHWSVEWISQRWWRHPLQLCQVGTWLLCRLSFFGQEVAERRLPALGIRRLQLRCQARPDCASRSHVEPRTGAVAF